MAALIVGGDRVEPFRDFLEGWGYQPVRHWNGRKPSTSHKTIPADTRLVVMLVDQINHSLALNIRRAANERSLPIVFSKRSRGQLQEALVNLSA